MGILPKVYNVFVAFIFQKTPLGYDKLLKLNQVLAQEVKSSF
jgi:hypothetical protein